MYRSHLCEMCKHQAFMFNVYGICEYEQGTKYKDMSCFEYSAEFQRQHVSMHRNTYTINKHPNQFYLSANND